MIFINVITIEDQYVSYLLLSDVWEHSLFLHLISHIFR
ncbi:hypothetical protein P689_122176 [Candidatus Riesia pediculischaeffi PTSU]|uniref:Uncharacterized protein n=1 Tax=Candidatus Riesia pediculischaeffi PTSU TaxID=1401651 RepID=A0A0C1S0C5_9ENTR|nr:hypothetical protein P689_122176 [Candidatus Riesia pediculischaeffi PTSU]